MPTSTRAAHGSGGSGGDVVVTDSLLIVMADSNRSNNSGSHCGCSGRRGTYNGNCKLAAADGADGWDCNSCGW